MGLVFGAVVHGLKIADPPQHGSLAADLDALGERIALLSDSEIAQAALVGLTAELDADAGLRDTLDARLWAAERRYLAVILERAAGRGEIRTGVDPELVRRLLVGASAITPIYGGGPTAAREAAAIVAAGLLARYPPSRTTQLANAPPAMRPRLLVRHAVDAKRWCSDGVHRAAEFQTASPPGQPRRRRHRRGGDVRRRWRTGGS